MKHATVVQNVFKLYIERKAIAEHFCSSNILSLLLKHEKTNQISVLIYVQMKLRGSLNKFPDFFVWPLLFIVHT